MFKSNGFLPLHRNLKIFKKMKRVLLATLFLLSSHEMFSQLSEKELLKKTEEKKLEAMEREAEKY